MKILILLFYKFLAEILDILNKFFNVPKLRNLREIVDAKAEQLEDMSSDTALLTALDSVKVYIFRPYEVKRIKYKSYTKNGRSRPYARSGHRIVCNDSTIYCFGGFNPNMTEVNDDDEASCLFQELWKFDIIRREWTLIMGPNNDLPQELASNAMLLQGDFLVVYGGTGFPFGVNCSNRIYFCQPGKKPKAMTEMEVKGDCPPAQYGQTILYHDGFLYTIGGTEGFDYTCDVYRLNVSSKTWECAYTCRQDIRDDPPGRYRHEIAFDNGKIYVIGGGTSDSAFSLASIPTYDIKQNVWTYTATKPDPKLPLPGVPSARKCHSCVQYKTENGTEVVIAGGYDGRLYYGDIWKLNLNNLEWRLMQKSVLPYPLFFHDAASNNEGCMYIFGGIKFSFNNNVRTNVIYKMWTTIPKLSEISWEAVLHYWPSLPKQSKGALLAVGIPAKFVRRVHEI
ncbi:kelch domain-containing protein 10 homolog [Topomyia yanbarensis]|uniref:kelch domain-containing protein 10 homolog n=1 Tax=Topomyia yanbarensis TaxID=2498891 RepID=UPI00273B17AE|nr:kelch domain-containing protein 10 homolog [Topomyia yanbarensis]